MTEERTEPLDQALAEHDVTRALSTGRLLLAVAVLVAIRLVRRDEVAMHSARRRVPDRCPFPSSRRSSRRGSYPRRTDCLPRARRGRSPGGTDLMVQITGELGEPPERVLDIWHLDELRGIRVEGDALVLGALTTYTEIRRSPLVAEFLPALAEAAATIGAAQIQNRGTLGGNVVNASPAGDTLPILLATGAEVVLGSARGEQSVLADEFWTAYRKTARADDELVLRVRIPLVPDREVRFRKIGLAAHRRSARW